MRQFRLTLAGTRFCTLTLVGFWRTTGTTPLRGATAPCCTEPLPLERAGTAAPLPDECALPDECPLPDEPALPLAADEVLPWPFAPSARAFPVAARITARPTTRIFVILAFLVRQHIHIIYSTPLPPIPLDHFQAAGGVLAPLPKQNCAADDPPRGFNEIPLVSYVIPKVASVCSSIVAVTASPRSI